MKRKIILLIVNTTLGAVFFLTACTPTTPPQPHKSPHHTRRYDLGATVIWSA